MPFPLEYPLRKILALILKAARRLPGFAAFEFRQYRAIERQLSQAQPQAIHSLIPACLLDWHGIRQLFAEQTGYRVIDIDRLSDDDREFLGKQGLSETFIAANKPGLPIGDREQAAVRHSADDPETAFQREALESRNLRAVCPKSGRILHSDRSLLAQKNQPIFYRFASGEEIFYLAVGRAGRGYVKLYLYLPDSSTVILLGDHAWNGRDEVDQFRAFLVKNAPAVLAYLNHPAPPKRVALVDSSHFAHHLWNALTGMQRLIAAGYADRVDTFAIAAEPLGPIERMFPEIEPRRIARQPVPEIIETALKNNFFLVRPGGKVVNDDVVDRVYRVAVENSSPEALQAAETFRKNHWPILWATIRTDTRSWISQAEGIAAIANKPKRGYPNLALVIDGYAVPYQKPHIDPEIQARLIREEQAVARKIQDRLDPAIEVRVQVGQPIFASVLYTRAMDGYLAHHGSLQHKIGWLSNKPGVVHSNTQVLSRNVRQYAAFWSRENGIPPVYLDPRWVTDVAGATQLKNLRWVDPLDHYDFDHEHAYAALAQIFATLEYPGVSD
jgi:hypothetical protein